MRSHAIIIVGVGFQDPTQKDLAEDNDVVQTLTPDRPDQLFGKAVLPRRGWCVQIDTVSSPEMPGFFELGISPHSVEAILERMLSNRE
jgi:hypothetical protein